MRINEIGLETKEKRMFEVSTTELMLDSGVIFIEVMVWIIF